MAAEQDQRVSRFRRFVFGSNHRRTLLRAVLLAVFAWIMFRHVLLVVYVDGHSMEPTVRSDTIHLASLWTYHDRDPQRGDVVVIAMAGRRVMYLKRVLAVPGDRIRFHEGVFYIGGAPVEEPYLVNRGDWTTSEYTLADGEYYVAGDNRRLPIELHETGIVERDRIIGGLLL